MQGKNANILVVQTYHFADEAYHFQWEPRSTRQHLASLRPFGLVLILDVPKNAPQIMLSSGPHAVVELDPLLLHVCHGTQPMHVSLVDGKDNLVKIEDIFSRNLLGPTLYIVVFVSPFDTGILMTFVQ